MKQAAADLKFEKAARIRDGLRALTIMQNQNIVEDFASEDRDYIAHWREGELVTFCVLKIRGGKLLGRDNFRVESLSEDDELLEEFAQAYYDGAESLPPKIFVDEKDNTEFLAKWLNQLESEAGSRKPAAVEPVETTSPRHCEERSDEAISLPTPHSSLLNPQSSRDIAALNMARENAKEDIIRRVRERGDMPALNELKDLLNLPRLPERIEGFDIAHIGGKFPVASLISFWKGNPDKKNYRYFRLKTTNGVIDDFASMREAATRRYSRLSNENAELPDLILIDGGIGQVNAVDGILKMLNLDIPIAGLAKRDEEIWRPHTSKPICLPKRSDALRLLQRVRDETHRFATSRNQNLRTKENTVSVFANLPHVGEKREKILIKTFTTLENLAAAEEAKIAQALHVRAAEASEILLAARAELEKRNENTEPKKVMFASQLGLNDTKEGSAESYTSSLADAALE